MTAKMQLCAAERFKPVQTRLWGMPPANRRTKNASSGMHTRTGHQAPWHLLVLLYWWHVLLTGVARCCAAPAQVLDTFSYADREFLQAFPNLLQAKVYVHFQSDVQVGATT